MLTVGVDGGDEAPHEVIERDPGERAQFVPVLLRDLSLEPGEP